MSGTGLLELSDVHAYYGNIRALKGVSLTVARGEIVTLIGSNGAGKTTTLRTVLGTVRPLRGTVTFGGKRIDKVPTHRIARLGIAQSPEGRRIFARMTVLENLELGAFARTDREAIPQDLERVVLRCLAKDPADRFPDAEGMERALLECACQGDWDQERATRWWREHDGAATKA